MNVKYIATVKSLLMHITVGTMLAYLNYNYHAYNLSCLWWFSLLSVELCKVLVVCSPWLVLLTIIVITTA